MKDIFVIYLILLPTIGQALECYKCLGFSRDKDCVYGYSTLPTQKCTDDYVCSTYQFEVTIRSLIRLSITKRGCQRRDYVTDCQLVIEDLKEELDEVGIPAKIRAIDCFSCTDDFCNSRFVA